MIRSGPPKIFAVIRPTGMQYKATSGPTVALRERIEGALGNPFRLGRVPMPHGWAGWIDADGQDKPHLPLNPLAMDLLITMNGPSPLGEEESVLGLLVISRLTDGRWPASLMEADMNRLDVAVRDARSAALPR